MNKFLTLQHTKRWRNYESFNTYYILYTVCDNMYYMQIDGEGEEQKLQYWCQFVNYGMGELKVGDIELVTEVFNWYII